MKRDGAVKSHRWERLQIGKRNQRFLVDTLI